MNPSTARESGKPVVVVLGGAGDMGYRVVKELVARGNTKVVIADYRFERARKLAVEQGRDTEALFVDANVRDSLVGVLEGAAVAVNCIGPFYRYAEKVGLACIQAGVSMVDICDDDDATVRMLALEGLARRGGVMLVVGVGWTPGISNLLAMKAASELDEAHDCDITWVGSTADSEGQAVVLHVLHAITRATPSYIDRGWVDLPALTRHRWVDFPRPIGRVKAYVCGHPEPLTIPRYMPQLRSVVLRGYLLPHEMQQIAQGMIDLGLLDTEKKKEAMAAMLQPLLPLFSQVGDKAAPPLSGIRSDVSGLVSGRPKTISYFAVDTMDRLTGIPPAIAADMLATGAMKPQAGVFAPEGCLPVDPFLTELAARDIEIEREENDGTIEDLAKRTAEEAGGP
ncbi:MAG: saccharopine dehydrogenase [Bacillota bacterium]|nr:MAG: saccharopine dehydrogenase [Bacillota bacterium]